MTNIERVLTNLGEIPAVEIYENLISNDIINSK